MSEVRRKSANKRLYAVACSLVRVDGDEYTHNISLHTIFAATEAEARGVAVTDALKRKPGFSIGDIVCLEVETE